MSDTLSEDFGKSDNPSSLQFELCNGIITTLKLQLKNIAQYGVWQEDF